MSRHFLVLPKSTPPRSIASSVGIEMVGERDEMRSAISADTRQSAHRLALQIGDFGIGEDAHADLGRQLQVRLRLPERIVRHGASSPLRVPPPSFPLAHAPGAAVVVALRERSVTLAARARCSLSLLRSAAGATPTLGSGLRASSLRNRRFTRRPMRLRRP